MNSFVKRHRADICGVLSCFDRVVITGTLPDICYPNAMASFLSCRNIRLFDYAKWAESLRDELRENAERIATKAGLKIEFIRKSNSFRKKQRIKQIIAERGEYPGLVHIF